jgi:copper chaperone CopZ
MQKLAFKVPNMDCKSCAEVIGRKLRSLEGVKDVGINLQEKTVNIQYENPNLCQEDVTCAVEDMGYKVQVI